MPIAIVTDSTADLSQEIIAKLPISIVPNILVMDGRTYLDGIDISREDFYTLLPSLREVPTTAAPASGVFQNIYEKLFDSGFTQIISIHAAGTLSGIINSASAAARSMEGAITVVDSGQLSLGIGFQVLEAAEAALAGLSLPMILERLRDVKQRLRVGAMLDTLEYVRRSGRVSWARASLGSLLNVKPFITLNDGKLSSVGETRTRHKGIERFRSMILEFAPFERLAILHTNAEEDAKALLASLDTPVPYQPIVVNVTTVIGTHVGPNGLGYAALLKA